MNKKKIGKYTLYAIGEIMILVIGIFFALQANRWDQERLNRIEEISILKAIKADLEQDLNILNIDMDQQEGGVVSSLIVQDHLENDRSYNDTLAYHFAVSFFITHWMYNKGGIQTLKSLGVNTIINNEIRKEIIYLYDVQYTFLEFLTEKLSNNYYEGERNILRTRFEEAQLFGDISKSELFDYEMNQAVWEPRDQRMVPLDYETLKNDPEYMFHLKTHMNTVYYYLVNCANTKVMITQLILNIEEEIERLEA